MFGYRPLPRTFEAALRDLKADKPQVRVEALRDLRRHAEDHRAKVIAAIADALTDKEADVRLAAATALADLEAVEAVDALIKAADDKDLRVRQLALAGLGEIGDARGKARVEKALSDDQPEVRFQAVMAFPRIEKDLDAATKALLTATRDDDPLVAHIALRMAEENAGDDGAIDPRVLTRAEALLKHASPRVAVAAAVILADAKRERGRDVLTKAAGGKYKGLDPEDEIAAIHLSGQLGLKDAMPGLERRAFGGILGFGRDGNAWHARVALARLGHERARREILGELDSWDRDKRTLAVAAAGRARLAEAKSAITAMKGDALRADPHAVDEALAQLEAAT